MELTQYAVTFYDPNDPVGVSTYWCSTRTAEEARIKGNIWYWGETIQTDLSVRVTVTAL